MIELSTFTYALKDEVLKKQHWYGPGKTPEETCDVLHLLAHRSIELVEKDYSKFDGTISHWLRTNVELALMLRFFHVDHHPTIVRNFETELKAHARSKTGVEYDLDGSRLSGSALTTDGNTLINAFASYCALRQVFTAQEAWDHMGLYYGDDGVDLSVPRVDYVKAAKMLGLDVKINLVPSGHRLMYLGRVYPNIWLSRTSYSDLFRALGKLHLVNAGTLEIDEAHANKAQGYFVTDRLTPILSQYCQAILKKKRYNVATMDYDELERINSPWPQPDEWLMAADISINYGITDLDAAMKKIENWDCDTEPPFLLHNEVKLPPRGSRMAVLGHMVEDPLEIHFEPNDCTEDNLQEIEVPGDGNCFYHAVNVLGVNKNLSPAKTRLAMRALYEHSKLSENWPWDVIKEELPDKTPVGLETIAFFAAWRQIRICVHSPVEHTLCGVGGDVYHIRYHNSHYTALRKSTDNSANMRPNSTLPADLGERLKSLASCKHNYPPKSTFPDLKKPNALYQRLNSYFGVLGACDPHDTLDGYNPSWKSVQQLPTLLPKNLTNQGEKHLVAAVLKALKLPVAWAPYITALCYQRFYYGVRERAMTDWPKDCAMELHPFTLAANLASLLHLDLTIRFRLNRTAQAVRYSVANPDSTLILALIDGNWNSSSEGAPRNSITSTNGNTSSKPQKPEKESKQGCKSPKPKTSAKTPSSSSQNRGQSSSPQDDGERSARGANSRSKRRGGQVVASVAPASNESKRHPSKNSRRTLRKMAPRKVSAANQLSGVSNDDRLDSNRVVTNPSTDHPGDESIKVAECTTPHEEPTPQNEQCGTQSTNTD